MNLWMVGYTTLDIFHVTEFADAENMPSVMNTLPHLQGEKRKKISSTEIEWMVVSIFFTYLLTK